MMSIVHSAKSPMAMKRKCSPGSDNLVKQCENLLKTNFTAYDDCIKLQEKLRVLLIKHTTNKDYRFLKTWLEKAKEDYLKIESNNGDLKDIYEVLLKNNFVEKFLECEVTLERLQLKFLKVMSQCKDLKGTLNTVDCNITFLKSEYRDLTSSGGSIEDASRLKTLRLKSLNVVYECERLNTCLNEACEEIVKLNSDYDILMQRYKVLSQDTIVTEFLDYANYQEKCQNECAKNSKKHEGPKSSLGQTCDEEIASLNLRLSELQQIAEKFTSNIESMRSSISNNSEPSDRNAIPEYSLAVISKPNVVQFKEEIDLGYSDPGEDEDPLGQSEDSLDISYPINDSYVPDNTEEEKVDVLLDSGVISAVDSSKLNTSAYSEKRVRNFFCEDCPGRFTCARSLKNHRRLCHERRKPGVPCPICGVFYPHVSDMKRHYGVHKRRNKGYVEQEEIIARKYTRHVRKTRSQEHEQAHLAVKKNAKRMRRTKNSSKQTTLNGSNGCNANELFE